mgnify:FL=1
MTCRPQTLNLLPQHCTLKTEYDSKTSPCSSHYEQVKGAWSSSIATTARENNGTLVRLGLKPRDDAPTSMGRGWNACVPLTRGLGIDSIYSSVRKEVYEMNCTQKQQLVCFPKVRVYKPWFRHFNDHKDFRNEGTVHLFSLMALFSYANFRSNERVINDDRYMEAPGQWICKLGALPRILRVHSKAQALELMEYFRDHGFLTFEILDEEKEILRFTIADWKEHCTHLQYNYYSYKGSGFFFFPLPVGRLLLKTARKEVGIVFSELDAIMDMWLHTILNDPKVRGSEYMPVVYYSNMRGMPLLSYTYLARRWGWSKSRVGRFMLKAGEYGIISRVSFSSSRGSVISMCRYREMIYGEGCEELELSRIGEIIGIAKAIDVVEADDSKLDISVESRVPPEKPIGKARKSLKIQVFLVVRSSFFARQIPLVFYSSLDWEMSEQEKSSRDPPKESTLGKEMKS